MAIDNPSGILCNVIAIANLYPNSWFNDDVIKVVIPSGMLCNIKAMVAIIPNLYKLSFLYFSVLLSINVESNIPNTINIVHIMRAGNGLYFSFNRFVASGINDIIEMVIIIPDANAKIFAIKLSCFLILKKHGIIPSIVVRPAKVVIKSDIFIFIVLLYVLYWKLFVFYDKIRKKWGEYYELWFEDGRNYKEY